ITMDELPQELIDQILLNCDALALSCLSRTSRSYALQVTHPSKAFIWKSLFLQTFDDPRPAMQINLHPRAGDEYDWMASLQKRFRAETIVGSAGGLKRVKLTEREELYETLLDIALTAALGGGGGDKIPTGKNIIWLIKLTEPYGQLIFHHQLWTPSPREVQLRSHLHVLIGLTKIDHTPDMRLNSRSYVYDISHYTPGALYGPFLDPDAPIPINRPPSLDSDPHNHKILTNWLHLRHIHHVFTLNFIDRVTIPTSPITRPLALPFIQANSASGLRGRREDDWAGIEGRWQVGFSFCDHRDLIQFNHYLVSHQVPNPLIDPSFSEALRFIKVDLRILAHGPPHPLFPSRPKIHFEGGLVANGEGFMASIVGWVCMTGDGQIRWHFTSGEQGHVIWSSEGVQIGGIRSCYGVLGSWTTVFHDDDDPVGPFWLHKIGGVGEDSESRMTEIISD
ncbi:hypothetical protein SISSUDRAFT_982912, partial [Sistotremastrum suecicum HHB10207 ss-3]